jgi:hypothetical protein
MAGSLHLAVHEEQFGSHWMFVKCYAVYFLVKLTCSGLVKIGHRKQIIDVELHIFMNMAIHVPDSHNWYAAHTSL